MVRISTVLFTVGSAFSSLATATTLYVNKGCILANGFGICHDKTNQEVFGFVDIYACVERESDGYQYAYCQWSGEIPGLWDEAFWGEDNCLYSAGSPAIQVGCSHSIDRTLIDEVY